MTEIRLADEKAATRVWPLPDTEPVEFPAQKCLRADWITDELVKELEL